MTKSALVLIDIQNDYFPGGAMECFNSISAAKNAGNILKFAREQGFMPIHIRHISTRPDANFFKPHTFGSELYHLVAPLADEQVIIKHYPNSFQKTDLKDVLLKKGVENLIICGMMSHMCIDATVRAAADKGFSCTLIQDACATRELSFLGTIIPANMVHAAYMSALSGLYARVCSTEELLSGIMSGI